MVTFCYVDGSLAKPSGFDTYLLQYGDLIAQLPLSRVIYIASDQRMFGQAARIFRRLLGAWWCGIQVGRGKTELQRLLEHFVPGSSSNNGTPVPSTSGNLINSVMSSRSLEGATMERYFANGKSKETVEWRGSNVAAKEPFALFDTYRLPHDYSFFGELTKGVPA